MTFNDFPHEVGLVPSPSNTKRLSPSLPPPKRRRLRLWHWHWPPLWPKRSSSLRSPSPTSVPNCPNCMSRPVAPNGTSGEHFDYCSKGCAKEARVSNSNEKGGRPDLYERSKSRPKSEGRGVVAKILFLLRRTSKSSAEAHEGRISTDEARRKADNTQIVRDLESSVDDRKGFRVSNFGELLLEDIFTLTESDVDLECHVFLFQKIFICCKEILRQRSENIEEINSNPETPVSGTSTTATPGEEAKKNAPLSLKECILIRHITQVTLGSSSEQKSLVVWWCVNDLHKSFTIPFRDEERLLEWEVVFNKLLNNTPAEPASERPVPRPAPPLCSRGGRLVSGWEEQVCISCGTAPMSDAPVLCQSCLSDALSEAPMIIELPKDHKNYRSVESQFKQTWRHQTTCPEVKAVYKIFVTKASLDRYQQYLDNVETRGNFAAIGKPRGNENWRWHGTRRKCYLGDPGYVTFCEDEGCSLCCIFKSSFNPKFFKSATGWGRFGHGIYTSSTSSKSNDYSKNVNINSELKALLLNKVVVGNGKKLTINDTTLTAPPPGFDSVLAEVAPGGSLNHDELVVYHNDAVRPSYLVMYKSS